MIGLSSGPKRFALARWLVSLTLLMVSVGGAHAEGRCTGDGALLKARDVGQEGAARVYYLLRGRRWLIPDEAAVWALALSFAGVCTLSQEEIDAIPRGPNIGVEGALFLCPRCPEPSAVYAIEDGARRHIANEHVMHDCLGLRDDDIFTVATQAFEDMSPPGWEFEADCEPGDVEADSCGGCGQQVRTCEASCTWSTWSPCIEGDSGCGDRLPAEGAAEASPAGCGAVPSSGGWPASMALAAALGAWATRRRKRLS